uniref:Ionotropic glutamate receptor C-terminal domain-containing protein n=1 Tax=Glossina austeni TaxID=7395 RepID=A0A1A9VGY6_GLOAU
MNEDYKYIIGNLDFHTFDLEEYKYSEANITGMRMFSAEQSEVRNLMLNLGYFDETTENEIIRNGSCPITMEMALTYDAVIAFAETTKHLQYTPHALNCSDFSIDVLEDGTTFKNYMRSILLDRNTITGQIYFEGSIRKGSQFEIIELQPTGLIKVGTWQEHKNFTFNRPMQMKPTADNADNSMINKTLRVLIAVPNKPYASLVESHKKLDGNSQYEGYGIDLIKELADKLGFNFTFINGGNDYDKLLQRADLAVTDLTITSEREEVIDFSIPFMNLGIGILYLKPQKSNPTTFSFMDPFSKEVWIYLGLAYLGVSLCFFILGRLSPTEWDNPYPCVEEPDELENQFTINNALWFTTGALLQQGSEVAPKALSTRTVAAIWCFFTLIMVSSYTANLAAFLTIENPTSLLENVQDLSENKGGVQYGAKRTGSTRNFFLTSEEEIYKKMNEYMLAHPEYLTETNQEGLERVKSSDVQNGKTYAFLMESTSIEYNTQRECKLTKIGEALDEKGYGIAMVKNWPYRDKFNNALLELQEQGVLAQLKNKWWNEIGAGVCNVNYLRRTFDYAIEVVNSDLTVPLTGHQETMDYGNIMQGVNRLCKLTKLGVGGIFAPSAENTASYMMHMCDSKDIPFVYSHLSRRYDALNLYPHQLDIAKAIHAIIEEFEWSRFIYLYENSEFLSVLDALMSLYVSTGPVINIVHYDLNLNGNFKSVLRRVRKSVDNRILIMGSTQSVAELLKQAQQVGIMNEDYKYIIGNLDFHTFDLEEYKYSEANITGMRMFSAEQSEVRNLMLNLGYFDETTENEIIRNGSCPITMEMALTYDAVIAFAETTKHLQYTPHALNCSDFSIDVLEDGTTFKNYMRSVPFSAALKEEFKAVTDFANNERLLKGANSIYSRSRNSSIDSTIDSFETDSNDESMSENEKEE